MDLQEAKNKAYSLYQSHLHAMRDVIENPLMLQHTGFLSLEKYLVSMIQDLTKREAAIFREYERDNP